MGSWGGTWSGQTGVLLSGAGDTARALTKAPVRRWWWLPQRDQPGGPFSPHLDIPLSVSRIERDECLPLGRIGHRAGSGRRRRPTVGWPFVLLLDTPAPLVLLGRQLPPATWTQGLPPPNRAGCSVWFRPCSMGRGGQCCPEMGRACSSNPGAGSRQGASKRRAGAREAQRCSRT